jgi:general secretion pathway protein D
MLNSFRAVDEIPYMISKVVPTAEGNVVTTEAKTAIAGLVINILPTLNDNGNYVNLSTDILVSEYLGEKTINVNGGEYKLPQINKNEIQMPARIKMGRSMVLTGFKLKRRDKSSDGIPGLVNKRIFGTLFGKKSDTKQTSEFVVVVTPERAY